MTAERDLDRLLALIPPGGEGGRRGPLLALHRRPREAASSGRRSPRAPSGDPHPARHRHRRHGRADRRDRQHPRRLRRPALQPRASTSRPATARAPCSACRCATRPARSRACSRRSTRARAALHRRGRGAAARARRPGRGGDRERAAARGDQPALRGLRQGVGAWRSSRATRPPPATPAASRSSPWGSPRRSSTSRPGRYAGARFTARRSKEIRYASLLHDFGKVGVREPVLVKAEKLYPHELRDAARALRARAQGPQARELPRAGSTPCAAAADAPSRRSTPRRRRAGAGARGELDEILEFVLACNQPTVLAQGGFERLAEIAQAHLPRRRAARPRRCSPRAEVELLSIPKGSLSAGGAAGDREPRHPHLPLPRADPVDARAPARPGDRLRAPREARRHRLPARRSPRGRSRCSRG